MFGITILSKTEKDVMDKKKRIAKLEAMLQDETNKRQQSLEKSRELQAELDSLAKS